jgi:hypothetical protein
MCRRAALTAALSRVDLMNLVRQIGQVMFCMETQYCKSANFDVHVHLMRTLSRIQAKRLSSNAVVVSDRSNAHGN